MTTATMKRKRYQPTQRMSGQKMVTVKIEYHLSSSDLAIVLLKGYLNIIQTKNDQFAFVDSIFAENSKTAIMRTINDTLRNDGSEMPHYAVGDNLDDDLVFYTQCRIEALLGF